LRRHFATLFKPGPGQSLSLPARTQSIPRNSPGISAVLIHGFAPSCSYPTACPWWLRLPSP
jgi:hypothetical protein